MITGITKRGYVSRTAGQDKMHVSTMTLDEINMIHDYLLASAKNTKPSLTYHLAQKIVSGEIKFTEAQLVETLANASNLVEFNSQVDSIRGLYRSAKDYEVLLDGKLQLANLCIVINPDRYTILDIKEVLYGKG